MKKKTKYQIIYEDLLKDIDSKKIMYGNKLPTEKQLIKKYNVSTITIRSALRLLQNDFRIKTTQGRGSIISDSPISIKKTIFKSIYTLEKDKEDEISFFYSVLKYEKLVNSNIIGDFEVGAKIIKLKRVRQKVIANKVKSFLISEAVILNKKNVNLKKEIFENKYDYNLISILEKNLNFNYSYSTQDLYSEKLSKTDSSILNLPENSQCLKIEWKFYNQNKELLFIDKELMVDKVRNIHYY